MLERFGRSNTLVRFISVLLFCTLCLGCAADTGRPEQPALGADAGTTGRDARAAVAPAETPADAQRPPITADVPPALPDAFEPDTAPAPPPDGAPAPPPGRLASQVPSGGLPGPSNACSGLPGENKLTPGSMIRYCVGAHPDCKAPGARCPLYVTVQMSGGFFGRLKDPAKYGKFITVEIRSTSDNEPGTLEAIAQVPRLVARDFPGLDEERIYIAGQSGGSYFIRKALCLGPKGDSAMAGAISDVYAAWASIVMCPKCDRPFVPKSGNFHVINIIGADDDVTAGQCQAELRAMATGLGCSSTAGTSCNVPAKDALVPQATGSGAVRKTTFGSCQRGSVVGYQFANEAHVVRYTKGFDPPVTALDMAWAFFQDKRKNAPGSEVGSSCGAP